MNKDTTRPLKVKERYKLSNWSSYNESLKKRGSLTIWFEEGMKDKWLYNGKQKPGGQKIYGEIVIECIVLKKVYT